MPLEQRLPVIGFPHLSIAAQSNPKRAAAIAASLQANGFTINPSGATPPPGADEPTVISAITRAFLASA